MRGLMRGRAPAPCARNAWQRAAKLIASCSRVRARPGLDNQRSLDAPALCRGVALSTIADARVNPVPCANMALIGKRNLLTIVRETQSGFYLDGGEHGEILLPGRYIPAGAGMGSEVDVFIYCDSEDRLVATTDRPRAEVGQFACMHVKDIHDRAGAFLDWGLPKDLLLPFREQSPHVRIGENVVVAVLLDPETNRIIASAIVNRHLSRETPEYIEGQPVELLIAEESPLGYSAIVDNKHRGLLYKTNLGGPLKIGARMKGYVKSVRSDGKLDLSLDPSGYARVAPLTEQILDALTRAGGRLNYDDSTDPEAIRARFGTSKKAFKQAIGALYRDRKIVFLNPGIQLVGDAQASASFAKDPA